MSAADAIRGLLEDAGVPRDQAERLAAYGQLVLEANAATNLTAARDPERFAEHIADSLTLAADVDGPLIDIGSGAGLPGIPLAIVTGKPVVLVDAVKKKAGFLRHTLRTLGLEGEALDIRAERLAADPAFRGRFAVATARAVATAPAVAELTVPFLAIGGKALLQRGLLEERERRALSDAALMLGAELVEERLIGAHSRVLVVRKHTPTQPRFPRRDGIPAKRPLCLA